MAKLDTSYSNPGDCYLLENGDLWLDEKSEPILLEKDLDNTPYTAVSKPKTLYTDI